MREHVLRKVQFSQTGRLDDLVNEVYNHFKKDFFPGEHIIAITDNGERLEGTIREKVSFPPAYDRDGGVVRPALSNYFVKLRTGLENEAFFDDHHITRDRKLFSKLLLRSFLKHSISREAHHNAVWTVKENIALEYKIPTELPPHLQPHVIAEQKKLLAQQKKMGANGLPVYFVPGQPGVVDPNSPHLAMRPGPKGRGIPQLGFSMVRQEPQFIPYQQGMEGNAPGQPGYRALYATAPYSAQFQEYAPWQPQPTQLPPPEKPLVPPKYPIDDLELPPRNNGLKRPALKFVAKPQYQQLKANGTNGETNGDTNGETQHDAPEVLMESVGLMLEIWNTLNVHEEVFLLDSFTFDDFLDAMRFVSDGLECELVNEIHCAVLKQLVDEEGKLLVELPEFEEDDEDEEDEESEESTPTPEPELRRTTRGSLRKSEAEALKKERSPSVDPNQPTHRAAEMLANDSWIDRLKVRDFRSGGWQFIMVGILRQLALNDRHTEGCEALLRELAPLDMPPNQETARTQYAWLNVNLKIKALQIICMLAVTTKALREYLERCSEDMTEMRKTKIEWQRARKPL